ncbi:glycosyltransferase family 4 protein [Cystobacter fuscus]
MGGLTVAWINESARPVGGAERYVRETARELAQHGVRSFLFYDVGASPDPSPVMLEPFEGAFPIVDLARQLRELAPDVVYVHQLGVEGTRALRDSPAPVMRFFHDHRMFCLREHKYTTLTKTTCTQTVGSACITCLGFIGRTAQWPGVKLASLRELQAEQELVRHEEMGVVGSEYMAGHIAAHGFDRARLHVLPLYARPPADAPQPVAREEDLLLAVGQLSTGKGIDVLLHALTRTSRPARLRPVGQGRQQEELKALTKALRLQDRVTFVGPLTSSEALSAEYRRAAALVFPSRAPETLGLVGLEALAHGTPVIGSLIGGIGEWLLPERTGLGVPSGNPAALAAAIDRMLGDKALREKMGQEGARLHRERFLPEHHVASLHRLLQRVASEGRRRA